MVASRYRSKTKISRVGLDWARRRSVCLFLILNFNQEHFVAEVTGRLVLNDLTTLALKEVLPFGSLQDLSVADQVMN